MSWEGISRLRTDLGSSVNTFKTMLADNVEDLEKLSLSISEYESRINVSLELQYNASYIVSILYNMSNLIKDKVKKGGTVAEQVQSKKAYEEVNSMLEEYKNHVYTFSQRARTLSDLLKIKQMANPDTHRY